MRALIDLIIKSKHWFLFVLLEVISLGMLFSTNGYPRCVAFTTANDVVGSFYDVISSVTSYLNLQEENHRLEVANQKLRRKLYAMEQEDAEARCDTARRMESLPSRYELIHAQIVNNTVHNAFNLITINKGKADGVQPEMGVVCSDGVVGIVYMTSAHYSIVTPLLNENSKISCRLRKSEFFGSLIWKHGDVNTAYLTNIPRHAKVKRGDIVETNGYSDIFPSGLPMGVVSHVGDSPDGMSYMLRVRLFTNFATLREVAVIKNFTSKERKFLEEVAADPDGEASQELKQKNEVQTAAPEPAADSKKQTATPAAIPSTGSSHTVPSTSQPTSVPSANTTATDTEQPTAPAAE